MNNHNPENKEETQTQEKEDTAALLGFELNEGEEVCPETLKELSNGKGDDNE